jgi:aminopeptidase YwaD
MKTDPDRLRRHIEILSEAPRPTGSRELEQARSYVAEQFDAAGWVVQQHPFDFESDRGQLLSGINLIARYPEHPVKDGPRFCVGAHLDSVPSSPGADDNASAVAALLEIARLIPDNWPGETKLELELVAFDLEENGMLGGAEHARLSQDTGIDLRGMVSLEMLGFCSHQPNSQQLPRTLKGLYPETGNFIAVVGNQNSGTLIERFRDGMQKVSELAVETLQVPSNGDYLQATRLSDHSPFWDAGYSAVMITDTSFMRNPHYHLPSDTLQTLDMEFLHRAAEGSLEAVRHILATGL